MWNGRWDHGAALGLIDVGAWVKKFNVTYVPSSVLENRYAAIQALTTLGKRMGLGEWEVLIDDELREHELYLLVHEAVENYLRRLGWLYGESHSYAEKYVEKVLGGTAAFRKFIADVGMDP